MFKTCQSYLAHYLCHCYVIQHGRPIQNSVIILEILKFLNYSYFAKLMTRKPKIGNLTNDRTLSISGVKKVVSAIQGDFVVTCDGRDATSKTKN